MVRRPLRHAVRSQLLFATILLSTVSAPDIVRADAGDAIDLFMVHADALPGEFGPMAVAPRALPNQAIWSQIGLTSTVQAAGNYGSGIKVGVFDGLANCAHAELTRRCTFSQIQGGRYRIKDLHATHVSAIIAGKTVGIANKASIVNYGVFDDKAWVATGSKLITAWQSAARAGVTIANMSFGCDSMALCFTDPEIAAMAGPSSSSLLFLKAAGNEGAILSSEATQLSQPVVNAAMARIILVGSVNQAGTISSFSNQPGMGCLLAAGTDVCAPEAQWANRFIVAPGENIYSAYVSGFGRLSGTSMATPIVAGVAALLESRWTYLKAQPAQVANILFSTATDLGDPGVDAVYGWGLINATRAMQPVGPTVLQTSMGAAVPFAPTVYAAPTSMPGLSGLVGAVAVLDRYGRDFLLRELMPELAVARRARSMSSISSLLGDNDGLRSYRIFGFGPANPGITSRAHLGPAGAAGGIQLLRGDAAIRIALDGTLTSRSQIHYRSTGVSSVRSDFLTDPAFRPLGFFASTDLQAASALFGWSHRIGADQRLTLYQSRSVGSALLPTWGRSMVAAHGRDMFDGLLGGSQDGTGLLWSAMLGDTAVHAGASVLYQKGRAYDGRWALGQTPTRTRLVNLAAAVEQSAGPWSWFGAAEMTRMQSLDGDSTFVAFHDLALVSADVGGRLTLGSGADGSRQTLQLGAHLPPRAIGGYVGSSFHVPDADGQPTLLRTLRQGGASLTGERLQINAGYQMSQGSRVSFAVQGMTNLSGLSEQAMITRLGWRF